MRMECAVLRWSVQQQLNSNKMLQGFVVFFTHKTRASNQMYDPDCSMI